MYMQNTTKKKTFSNGKDTRTPMNTPLIRADLANLEPYDPDMREVRIMLSANENSYGMPQSVWQEALSRLAAVEINRYPLATAPRLRGLLAQKWNVEPANIVVSNGGDELLFNIELAYGGPGRALVNCTPTFSSYALYAELTLTKVIEAPRHSNFDVDEDALLKAAQDPEVSLIVVTSPNNPTGNLANPAFVEKLAQSTGALVLVDEAYGEFAPSGSSCVPLVSRYDNVCVLRTLSKAYALAGARLGYIIAPKPVADVLLAVRQPYSVSSLDQTVAEVVLEHASELDKITTRLVENRAALLEDLLQLAQDARAAYGATALEPFPSEANFIMLRIQENVAGMTATDVHEILANKYSILVRNFSRTLGLGGCLRFTVGTQEQNGQLICALREIFGCK